MRGLLDDASLGGSAVTNTYVEDLQKRSSVRNELATDELENLKLLRVKSEGAARHNATKGEKFQTLYGMYVSQKASDSKKSDAADAEREVVRLRGQIDALKNKSSLSSHDKLRLVELQEQLKAVQRVKR